MNPQISDVVASPLPHLPNPDEYALTIGEASELMRLENCKFASPRKVQRLCREGHLDCKKITTSRNGQPIVEWLVNEASLRKRIVELEPKIDDDVAVATPDTLGGASKDWSHVEISGTVAHDMAAPNHSGAASNTGDEGNHERNMGDAIATPADDGDATFVEPSKAMLMIENAKLTAELVGKTEFIDQILDDKSFLREELRDARERGRDVTKIAQRMLETLETIAMGGKLDRSSGSKLGPSAMLHQPVDNGDIEPSNIEKFGI